MHCNVVNLHAKFATMPATKKKVVIVSPGFYRCPRLHGISSLFKVYESLELQELVVAMIFFWTDCSKATAENGWGGYNIVC